MLRRLFTLLSAASLVLCAATCVLWARSHWHQDGFVFARGGRLTWGRCDRGKVALLTIDGDDGPDRAGRVRWGGRWDWGELPPVPGTIGWGREASDPYVRLGGFQYVRGTQEYLTSRTPFAIASRPFRLVVVPLWSPAAATAWPVLPLAARAVRRVRSRWVPEPGRCPVCGYNLRATPVRCPECGAVPAKNHI